MANAKAQALSSHAFDACGGGGAAPTGPALKAMASFDNDDWDALDMDARIAMEESSVEAALCLENPSVSLADIEAASAAARVVGTETLSAGEAACMEEMAHPLKSHNLLFGQMILHQGYPQGSSPKDPPPGILPCPNNRFDHPALQNYPQQQFLMQTACS